MMVVRLGAAFATIGLVAAHGSMVHPRPRNSIDYLVNVSVPARVATRLRRASSALGRTRLTTPLPCSCVGVGCRVSGLQVNTQWYANLTGDKCENGQAAFYYSQVRAREPASACASPHRAGCACDRRTRRGDTFSRSRPLARGGTRGARTDPRKSSSPVVSQPRGRILLPCCCRAASSAATSAIT